MTVSTYKPGLTCSCPDYQNAHVAANACLTCPNGCFLQWQSTPCHFHWLNVSDDLWWIDLLLLDHRRHDPGRHEHCLVFHRQTPRSFRYMSMQAPLVFSLKSSICVSPSCIGYTTTLCDTGSIETTSQAVTAKRPRTIAGTDIF